MSLDMDHDYPMKVKEEGPEIKEEPADLEDEDIAEEIAEDRLNQIIKDEMVRKAFLNAKSFLLKSYLAQVIEIDTRNKVHFKT